MSEMTKQQRMINKENCQMKHWVISTSERKKEKFAGIETTSYHSSEKDSWTTRKTETEE